MVNNTCCVTGHRDIPADKVEYVKKELRREIEQAIGDGYTYFISGFADGADMYFSAIVAELRRENDAIHLEAALPYRKRLVELFKNETAKKLIACCTAVGVHSEEYFSGAFMKRNRFMVAASGRVIAVYDGRKKGGTLFTMRDAYAQERDVRVIRI